MMGVWSLAWLTVSMAQAVYQGQQPEASGAMPCWEKWQFFLIQQTRAQCPKGLVFATPSPDAIVREGAE